MNYGFIGAGNMAYSIIAGMISNGVASCKKIHICEKNAARSAVVQGKLGVSVFNSSDEISEKCDVVFLAVKPHHLPDVLTSIADSVKKHNPIIVSIAAGKTVEFIESFLDKDAKIVRVMPNINAEIGKSTTAFCCNKNISKADKAVAVKCLDAIGSAAELDESLFPIFTAVASCSPAFVYMFIDALATAAVKNGINKQTALDIAAQTVLGSAEMALNSSLHPRELADNVCSPGGATVEGVCSLVDNGFESAVLNAVAAAYNKVKEL